MSNPRRPGGSEPRRTVKPKARRRWLLWSFLVILGLGLGAAIGVGGFVYKAYASLPAFEEFDPSLTSVIYDVQGRKVYELADEENRTLAKLADVPLEIRQALVATEDARFYDHFGVDVWRVGGAVWANVKYFLGMKGSQLEGASTLTMQLTRNAFLTLDQNMFRKVQEALIAIELERRFTKDELLEKYLNQVSFGMQAHGIEAAAQTYFSKHAKELTLSEGAMLVGILKATSFYNPFENMEGAMNRRAVVLDQMVKYGYLTKPKADALKKEQPEVKRAKVNPSAVTFTGDWYVDHVISILTDNPPGTAAKYGAPVLDPRDLYHKGLEIHTALDLDYQKVADAKVAEIMPKATKEYGSDDVPEAAVVIMNHQDGHVKAITGGMEHKQMLTYNRATQAYRQPGSSIKPLVAYLPAIDLLGWGPATAIDDSPPMLTFPDKKNVWPENYEFQYRGLKPLRWGVEQSINAMAVRALEAVTPKKGLEYARKMGLSTLVDASISSRNDENLALALGGLTTGVTPLEMTGAYGTLGSLGTRVDPVIITKIVNKNKEIIFQAQPKRESVVRKESVWLMVDVMKGSIQRGTAAYWSKGFNGWPAAGKTGTTEDWHDAWFVGFTPEIVTGIWTGYDKGDGKPKRLPGRPGENWTGAGPPTRIWTAIMNEIIKEKPADWVRPAGITWVEVCKTSGMLPSPLCPKEEIGGDWFRKGAEPARPDNVWTVKRVVRQSWINPKTKKPMDRWYLWREGCGGTPENRLMIQRPTTYVKHPTDPWNFARYWPADYALEVPTETCTVVASVPSPPAPGQPDQPGTEPPWLQPPGTQPPPGGQPPVSQPPGTQPPPGGQPPVSQPPGTQPPGTLPPAKPPATEPVRLEPGDRVRLPVLPPSDSSEN